MAERKEQDDHSFNSWLFSRQEIFEKTAGLVVLVLEVLHNLGLLYSVDEITFTHVLNLLFLLFIIFFLRKDFRKRFYIAYDDPEVIKIMKLSHFTEEHRKAKIKELTFNANTFVAQLKNINYFFIATAALYVCFLLKSGFFWLGKQPAFIELFTSNNIIQVEDIKALKPATIIIFHIIFDIFSYIGAFYLLRCFYVMYLPTIDVHGNDILKEQTFIYILIGIALILFDIFVVVQNKNGLFIAEFICGIINSVVFILLIARFENKLLDIPPTILSVLYVYAILQSCLLFVTGDIFGDIIKGHKDFENFLSKFSSIILTICLVGKITFSAVILYVLNSGRLFYYFITQRKIHTDAERQWRQLNPLIKDFSIEPEKLSLMYTRNSDGRYIASIPVLDKEIDGQGATAEEAKENLLDKIRKNKNSY